jgi:hypothetical protein
VTIVSVDISDPSNISWKQRVSVSRCLNPQSAFINDANTIFASCQSLDATIIMIQNTDSFDSITAIASWDNCSISRQVLFDPHSRYIYGLCTQHNSIGKVILINSNNVPVITAVTISNPSCYSQSYEFSTDVSSYVYTFNECSTEGRYVGWHRTLSLNLIVRMRICR